MDQLNETKCDSNEPHWTFKWLTNHCKKKDLIVDKKLLNYMCNHILYIKILILRLISFIQRTNLNIFQFFTLRGTVSNMYKVIKKIAKQRRREYTAKTNILLHDMKKCDENYDSCILLCEVVLKWIFFNMRTISSDEEWNIDNTVNPIKTSTHWNQEICKDPQYVNFKIIIKCKKGMIKITF